ncbi:MULTISPECIES: bifunctional phosphopantothenoylcysteine decarboxylase/phosphopantothenate--cysteine ligase CoaBC [Methanosphaera]|uniref:Coenzyme A biosynthesis bifunctional protein CoaBC n=2 Tax=Methanosphaera stadtmanae TaxID=2317 RepID=Q2NEF8_METST|nr:MULTISPECIES: bifunctional phosphopantothenoylcysteine decarboxylase/phosphopantothenate--cysteine ligase CoaBC [Methanosphaera]ABC57795.1 predicted phosphopantothenoylcysteine synthetase/decarboxylase [Methanosphaera stadtmanae DSM 3091]MEE0489334.1 bifunctional phosphopantothenoylcysteine decarboxylase/phosphopantothenate--cysteine ligase CoaBC [Methanosphaera stadtmanae]OEC86331.1 bifunctional phosphopantothenoylcysteine decarboxylase/phosphopantothenate synthase [Methanosphaera sp. A6]RA
MKIILCVTGSIAATEDLKLVHQLQRHGFDVECFMTDDACDIITPLSMEFATKNPVVTKITGNVEHVKNAQADLILVAPATANTISKFAYKIADTSVTTLLLTASGYKTPILFVPSMHISMYHAIEENINKIKEKHPEVRFIEPTNEERKAKFPSKHDIVLEVERMVSENKLDGMNVVITAGGTFEEIDAMRGITNRSSGKMGVEIAKEAYRQGANVTLICGITKTHIPKTFRRINVESSREMAEVVKKEIINADIFVSTAAVSDFEVENKSDLKYSSDNDLSLNLRRLPKILEQVREINSNIFIVGFKAEAGLSEGDLIKKATNKKNQYDVDLMVANDILVEGAGPGCEDNEVYLISDDGCEKLCLDSKWHISQKIIDRIYKLI